MRAQIAYIRANADLGCLFFTLARTTASIGGQQLARHKEPGYCEESLYSCRGFMPCAMLLSEYEIRKRALASSEYRFYARRTA